MWLLFVTYDDQCCKSVLLVSTTKTVLENSFSSYYRLFRWCTVPYNCCNGTVYHLLESPSHRKLKKSIEEVGTDFLMLPCLHPSDPWMSKMAGRHQLTLSAHGGERNFPSHFKLWKLGSEHRHDVPLTPEILPHLLLLLKISFKFLANSILYSKNMLLWMPGGTCTPSNKNQSSV